MATICNEEGQDCRTSLCQLDADESCTVDVVEQGACVSQSVNKSVSQSVSQSVNCAKGDVSKHIMVLLFVM